MDGRSQDGRGQQDPALEELLRTGKVTEELINQIAEKVFALWLREMQMERERLHRQEISHNQSQGAFNWPRR